MKGSIVRRVIVICLLLGGGGVALRCIVASIPPSVTTDVSRYEEILGDWKYGRPSKHFPQAIPANATEVRLSFFPGFLQGGAHFQIRMCLPSADVAMIDARMREATTHQYQGGSMFDHYNEDQENNLPTTAFFTADDLSQTIGFPEHYTLYVLSAKEDTGGGWNHGSTSGVAVSTQNSEVIYWAEDW